MLELVRGHLSLVLVPVGALIAQELLEDLLTQNLRHELGFFGEVNSFTQGCGQRVVAHSAALRIGHGGEVLGHGGHERVLVFDALQTGGENHRVGEVWVRCRVQAAVLDACGLHLVRLVQGHAHEGGAVVVAPGDVGGCLAAAPEALVGVDELVGDRGEFGGVLEHTGDEVACGLGQLVFGTGFEECVGVAFEEGEVGVHAAAGVLGEGLGHEGCVHAQRVGDFLDDGAEGHDVVGGLQGVGVAQVDFVLAGAGFVVAEFDGDADLFEHGHCLAAEVLHDAAGGVVEVGFVVHGHGESVGAELGGFEQVELNFGRGVAGEAHLRGLVEHALEHAAGVGGADLAVGGEHVTEHAGGVVFLATPGQDLEGGGVRLQQHVGFVDAGEALNRGAVKAQALIEGTLYFSRCERNGFEGADHVGEPEADEADVALFDGAQYEFLLTVHELPSRCGRASAWYPSAGGGGALNLLPRCGRPCYERPCCGRPFMSHGFQKIPEDSRGVRRAACQRCWRLLAPACVLLLSSLSGSAVWRAGGRFRLCKFSLVCSRLCAAVAQILGSTGGGRVTTPPLSLRSGGYFLSMSAYLCPDSRHMTVRGACSGSPCDNGGMLHSILLSTVQFPLTQLPLATSIVAADPTGLEWLLLIAAPVVFCIVYLACIMAIAAFGPLVMRNNKSGGATYLLDRPSRVAFRTRTVALFAVVGAFVELLWLGYTGRVGSMAVIPILLFTWSWKFAFFFLPLQLIRAWYVHATRGKYDSLSAEGAQRREKLNRKSAYEVSKMMQREPQQFAMSKELHTLARGQKIAGVRPFQNLDEAGKKRRTNYTVELAVALMQARAMNPGKLPSEAFGEGILGMGVGMTSDRAVNQTWLTLCTERVNAPDAPNYPDSLYPVAARFSLFTTMSLLQPVMGRPYSPFTAEDARRFVPRDFSADTVLLKTEELGKKALAQSAIFRQLHERLLPLHQQQPQLVDGRALAYCGALQATVAKAEAQSQRLTSQILAAAASERGILSYGLFSQIAEDYQCVQRLLNLMVKATANIERFINAVEALVQMHSGPAQPSGIAYEKVQMEYIAALLEVIVFSSHAPLAGSIQASYALLKADYEAFTFNTTDELSRSYWLQYAKNAVSACDTGLSQGYEGFFGSDDAAKKAWESYAEDVVKEVCTYSIMQLYWDALVQQALIQRDLPREFEDASSAIPELMNKNAAASFPTYYINLIWN